MYQQTPPSIARKMSQNYGAAESDSIARQRAPHAALVNSIKKLSRDRITPTAASQKITLPSESEATAVTLDAGSSKDEMLQKFKLESHNSKQQFQDTLKTI